MACGLVLELALALQSKRASLLPLTGMLQTLHDVSSLNRCGFITDLAVAINVTTTDPMVKMDDAAGQRYLRLLISILRHRTSSCGWFDIAYPGAFGLMLRYAKEGLQKLKLHVSAVEWCLAGDPLSHDMAMRSSLKSGKFADGWCTIACWSTSNPCLRLC